MFYRPHKVTLIFFAVLLVLAIGAPNPWVLVLLVAVVLFALLRWHIWQGEYITLTSKRIIRKQGVAETDWSESSIRLDRISGVWVVQTVPGKWLNYATIELAAPGTDEDTHTLRRIADPQHFYETLRWLVFGDPPPGSPPVPGAAPRIPPDPDDDPRGYDEAMRGGEPSRGGGGESRPGGGRPPGPHAIRHTPPDVDVPEQDFVTQPLPVLPERLPRRGRRRTA